MNQSTLTFGKQLEDTCNVKRDVLQCCEFDRRCSLIDDQLTDTPVQKKRRICSSLLNPYRRMSKQVEVDRTRRKDTAVGRSFNAKKDRCIKAINKFKDELNRKLEVLKQETIAKLDEEIKYFPETEMSTAEIEFEKNCDIEQMLDGINTLGTCSIRSANNELSYTGDLSVTENVYVSDSCEANESMQLPYKVLKVEKQTIPLVGNKKSCSFTSCIVAGSRYILLADNTNKTIYLIDKVSFTVKSWLELSGSPWFIAKVNDTKVVVSVVNDNESWLQFVDIEDGSLKEVNKLTMNHWCIGVEVLEDEIYVTDFQSSIYVYTFEGEFRQKFESNLFSCPLQICLSDGKMFMYIADRNNGLINFSIKHKYFRQLNELNLRECWGFTTDGAGRKFISNTNAHTIVISILDKPQIDILTEEDGLKHPKAVCYDPDNCTLFVTCSNSNELFVVTLKAIPHSRPNTNGIKEKSDK